MTLPIFADKPAQQPLDSRMRIIREQLITMDEAQSLRFFELSRFDRVLKTTISLCPQCLAHVPAIVYALDDKVLIAKECPDHGPSSALVENDIAFYRLSNKDRWGRRFADDLVTAFPNYDGGGCCGDDSDGCCGGASTDQMSNKTCTVLVEVTNACNLACPVCYSDARGDRKMPLDLFKQYMLRLIDAKGGLDSVQLTGGEAMLHPEFWEMIAFLHERPGVKRIYLPTNGILLARRAVAERLVPFKSKLMVLLQFDGRDPAPNRAMRAADTTRLRQEVIENLKSLKIYMQLTMTIARGVNDADVGWVVDTALNNAIVKVAALQPVTYSGRYDLPPDPMQRLTLSDIVKAVTSQARRRVSDDQFIPIPCSHPNCGWVSLFARRFGLTMNIMKHVDLPRAMNEAAYKTILSTDEIRNIVGPQHATLAKRFAATLGRKIIRARDVVGVVVKPFMDRFNYDQDRISACCHHLLDTHGNPVSFCEYNALLRPSDPWDRFPLVHETSTSGRLT